MNKERTVTDEELDLLAEGEFSAAQREELFRRLDEQPWQWKHCALAILEARAVGKAVRSLVAAHAEQLSPDVRRNEPASMAMLAGKPPAKRPAGIVRRAIVAGSILLALAAGTLGGYHLGGRQIDRDSIAALDRDPATDSIDRPAQGDARLQTAVQSLLQRLNVGDEQMLAVVRVDEGDKSRFVPVVSSKTLADRLSQVPPLPVRPQQIQAANRKGWNVLQHQQLIAIEHPSAKTEIVPVQMLRYKFVGKATL